MKLPKLELKNKNNKLLYYLQAITKTMLLPAPLQRHRLRKILDYYDYQEKDYITKRVNYYNRLSSVTALPKDTIRLGAIKMPARKRVYYFDSQEHLRYFSPSFQVSFHWGDITFVPNEPALVKSRPICPENSNSVILKLDKVRHFNFIKDSRGFKLKKNKLIGWGCITQSNRIRFYKLYFNHFMCDLGQINENHNRQWIKDRITIGEHLDYKFILALEGNDVATNLKWIMSSNSLAVMPTPKFETWFMEATLIPDYHYIHIKDDFSNLEEKLDHYIRHTEEALQIIRNANHYVKQFKDKRREKLISLLVLEKYFYRTGQLIPNDPSWYDE